MTTARPFGAAPGGRYVQLKVTSPERMRTPIWRARATTTASRRFSPSICSRRLPRPGAAARRLLRLPPGRRRLNASLDVAHHRDTVRQLAVAFLAQARERQRGPRARPAVLRRPDGERRARAAGPGDPPAVRGGQRPCDARATSWPRLTRCEQAAELAAREIDGVGRSQRLCATTHLRRAARRRPQPGRPEADRGGLGLALRLAVEPPAPRPAATPCQRPRATMLDHRDRSRRSSPAAARDIESLGLGLVGPSRPGRPAVRPAGGDRPRRSCVGALRVLGLSHFFEGRAAKARSGPEPAAGRCRTG